MGISVALVIIFMGISVALVRERLLPSSFLNLNSTHRKAGMSVKIASNNHLSQLRYVHHLKQSHTPLIIYIYIYKHTP